MLEEVEEAIPAPARRPLWDVLVERRGPRGACWATVTVDAPSALAGAARVEAWLAHTDGQATVEAVVTGSVVDARWRVAPGVAIRGSRRERPGIRPGDRRGRAVPRGVDVLVIR